MYRRVYHTYSQVYHDAMYHVQTCIYNNECMYFIHTMFRPCIHTNIQEFVYMFVICMYVRIYRYLYVCSCAYMFRPCIYHVHTGHVRFHFAMNKKYKKKKYCKALGKNPGSCALQPAALTTAPPACL